MIERATWVSLGFILFAMLSAYGIVTLDRKLTGEPTGNFTTLRNVRVFKADSMFNSYLIGHTRDDMQLYQICAGWNPGFQQGMRLKVFTFENRQNCKSLVPQSAGYIWEVDNEGHPKLDR